MDFIVTFTLVAAITTICLVVVIITIGVMFASVYRSRAELEAILALDDSSESPGASWHPSENV